MSGWSSVAVAGFHQPWFFLAQLEMLWLVAGSLTPGRPLEYQRGESGPTGLGRSGDPPSHPREDDLGEWGEGKPVEAGQQSAGVERRPLAQTAPVFMRLCFELQPGFARELHFCVELEETTRFDRGNSPEVHGLPNPQVFRVPSPSAQTDSTDEGVHDPSQRPGPIRVVVADLATDPAERPEEVVGRRRCLDGAFVVFDGGAGPFRIGG